jgi:hypothetical protein
LPVISGISWGGTLTAECNRKPKVGLSLFCAENGAVPGDLGGKKRVKENYSATEDSVFWLLESKIQIFLLADAD